MGADLRSGLRLSFMEAVKGATKDVTVTYLTIGQVRSILLFYFCICLSAPMCVECLVLCMCMSPTHPPTHDQPKTKTTQQDGRPTRKTKTVTVDVPPGVDTGVSIRMAGQGGEGRGSGAQAGNLYLTVEVRVFLRVFGCDVTWCV
jgi:DnaJ-class molecular chaperone